MINDISGERIGISILMKDTYTGSYLIVEGDRDHLLYKKFIDHKFCQIINALGKKNVIDAIQFLNHEKHEKSLGIIDKDYDAVRGITNKIDNLIESDFHDLEISILLSPAFEIILEIHATKDKLADFKKRNPILINAFLELAKPLGILKLANIIYDLGLVFKPKEPDDKPLDLKEFIDKKTLKYLGDDAMINSVIKYSRARKTNLKTFEVIREKYLELSKNKYDLYEVCNGHHVTALFHFALRQALSNYDAKGIAHKDLEIQLVLAYESLFFQKSHIYPKIKEWEKKHGGVIISF